MKNQVAKGGFYFFQKPVRIRAMVSAINKQRWVELQRRLADLSLIKKEISQPDFGQHSISDILEIILAGAVIDRASDIHLEPEAEKVKIRYRIDGLLHDITSALSKEVYRLIVSRIKLSAKLKLDIVDKPQDGRFSFSLPDREIELRVSAVPSEYGETIVIRVLDPLAVNILLHDLGLRADDLAIIEKEIRRPQGMILNTGPTGSGKTTTLYSFLKQRRSPEVKIITIEDPIEYHLEGIEQTQVNFQAGYTFANGLASIMRQDPDIILVGEIRDEATAGIALQAALTGHLVFSTVHANRAAAAVPRLLDLGAKPSTISSALNLILAQRLVRKLCDYCRQPEKLAAGWEARLKRFLNNLPARVKKADYLPFRIYRASKNGCQKCGGTGYWGRTGIFELLAVGREVKKMIEQGSREAALEEFALSSVGGMVTIQQDSVLKVLQGITDFTEVERITGSLLI